MKIFGEAAGGIRGLCVVVLIAGGLIRFWELPQRGIIFYDEAVQALQARALSARLTESPGHESVDPRLPSAGKHGHVFLVALAMCGVGPHDWAGGLLSAVFGTASLYVVYRLGTLMSGPTSGLLAMAFLAFSGLHVAYSREGLAEADTTFFFLLAAALLLEAHARARAGIRSSLVFTGMAGLASGATILCHYRAVVYVLGLLVLTALTTARHRASPIRKVLGVSVFVTLAAVPLLGCEILLRLARSSGLRDVPTYFEDLAFHYSHMAERSGVFAGSLLRYEFLLGYVHGFAETEGPMHLALAAFGLVVLLRRRSLTSAWVALLVLGPWVFYGLRAGGGLRYLSLTLPFLAISKGEALLRVGATTAHRIPGTEWRRWGPVAGLLVIALTSSPWIAPSLAVQSPYRAAMDRIEHSNPPARIVSTAHYVCSFYADSVEVLFPPDSEWELYTMYQDSVRYFVIDHERFSGGYFANVGDAGFAELTRRIRRSTRPLVAIPNPLPRYPQYILEGTVDYDVYRSLHEEIHHSSEFDTLGIYDLDTYFSVIPEHELRERALRDFESRLTRGGEISAGRLFIYLHSFGYLLWRAGEIDRAMTVYKELLDRYPGTLTGHLALGGLYEAKRDAREALHHYEEALRLAPESVEAKDRADRMRRILLREGTSPAP